MAKMTDEFRVAKTLGKALNDYEFQPFILASHIVNEFSLHTQDMLMEFIVAVFEYQRNRYVFNEMDGDRENAGIVFGTYMAYAVDEYKEEIDAGV